MSAFQPATKETVAAVLQRMADMCAKSEPDAEIFAEEVNRMLDDLLNQDFFGTEGQLDPRGDHRD